MFLAIMIDDIKTFTSECEIFNKTDAGQVELECFLSEHLLSHHISK